MFRSLYFKIVMILLIFVTAVMCVVGAILITGVSSYYVNDFYDVMDECFDDSSSMMSDIMTAADAAKDNDAENDSVRTEDLMSVLATYSGVLGIDRYRNYYILNMDADMLDGSDKVLGQSLIVTPNILSAIRKSNDNTTSVGSEYADWAYYLTSSDGEDEYIIYIKDSLDEMRQLNQVLFSIIIEAVFIGVIIAIILSFVLARSISAPLQNLSYGTQLVAQGDFSYEIDIHSGDEIGILTQNFNHMKDTLEETLGEISGEREKLSTVLSCIHDGVIAFTADGRVLHSNKSADEQFKFSPDDKGALGKVFDKLDLPLVVKDNRIRISSRDSVYEKTRDGFIFHDKVVGNNVYDVNFSIVRYITGDQKTYGFIIVMHDVTNRYELDESRREFVANVSHELRTPLTSIKGATETVLSDPEMDTETREFFLNMVLTESDRMTRIVSDLLVLSRLDSKRTKWNIETFSVPDSVRHLCDVMKTDAEAHRHELTYTTEENMPEVTGDKQRIEQVIINIISNAIKYTPDGGHIDVSAENCPDRDSVLVKVKDDGVGISQEDIAHIFERFYRVEKSRTTEAGGTGLGLAIAKELIEAHGGSIKIDSELNKGTTMTVEIPVKCRIREQQ